MMRCFPLKFSASLGTLCNIVPCGLEYSQGARLHILHAGQGKASLAVRLGLDSTHGCHLAPLRIPYTVRSIIVKVR